MAKAKVWLKNKVDEDGVAVGDSYGHGAYTVPMISFDMIGTDAALNTNDYFAEVYEYEFHDRYVDLFKRTVKNEFVIKYEVCLSEVNERDEDGEDNE